MRIRNLLHPTIIALLGSLVAFGHDTGVPHGGDSGNVTPFELMQVMKSVNGLRSPDRRALQAMAMRYFSEQNKQPASTASPSWFKGGPEKQPGFNAGSLFPLPQNPKLRPFTGHAFGPRATAEDFHLLVLTPNGFTGSSIVLVPDILDPGNAALLAASFSPFTPYTRSYWDTTTFYLQSDNSMSAYNIYMPNRMTGITAWQQQIPLPTSYFAATTNPEPQSTSYAYNQPNYWRLPLVPTPAATPTAITLNLSNCSTTAGSSTVTCGSTTGMYPSMLLLNTGLNGQVTVSAVTSSTQFTMSSNATATTSGQTFVATGFTRGAIAVAANGVAIFNPHNNTGKLSYEIGELDVYGGHCGLADDYHYHIIPTHLSSLFGGPLGNDVPIAWSLDGYPYYGFLEPDGTPQQPLDSSGGHTYGSFGYHYHAPGTTTTGPGAYPNPTPYGSPAEPYTQTGFHGAVVNFVDTAGAGTADGQPEVGAIRASGTGGYQANVVSGAQIIGFMNPVALTTDGSGNLKLNTTASVTLTGCGTTLGSSTVSCASTAGLFAGMSITGFAIPNYSTITSITNSTQFVISGLASSTNTGQTFTAFTVATTGASSDSYLMRVNVAGVSYDECWRFNRQANPPTVTVTWNLPGATTTTVYSNTNNRITRYPMAASSLAHLPGAGETEVVSLANGGNPPYEDSGQTSLHPQSFTNNGDGTITDNVTGLMWQAVDNGESAWATAEVNAASITTGGHTDWRLPTPTELQSIQYYNNNLPALNTTYFSSSPVTIANCTTTAGSTVVTCTSTAGISLGGTNSMGIIDATGSSYTYIPQGDVIQAVVNPTTFLLKTAAKTSGTGLTLTAQGADYWWTSDSYPFTGSAAATNAWCVNAGGGVGPKPLTETLSATNVLTNCSTTSGSTTITCTSTSGLEAGSSVSLTGCSTTSGSTTVSASSTGGLAVGMIIAGSTNIPTNAFVISINNSANTVVISSAATATGSSLTLTGTALSGETVSGPNIPAGASIVSVTNSTKFVISAPATATATGQTLTVNGHFRYCARYVRGGKPTNAHNYVNNNDGTITDTDTSLMWTQVPGPAMSWTNALTYPSTLTTGGHTDWRLPNVKELGTLTDYTLTSATSATGIQPSINRQMFGVVLSGCSTTAGSTTVTCSTTTGLQVGMPLVDYHDISGSSILATTPPTITAVGTGSFTISSAATGTGSGLTLNALSIPTAYWTSSVVQSGTLTQAWLVETGINTSVPATSGPTRNAQGIISYEIFASTYPVFAVRNTTTSTQITVTGPTGTILTSGVNVVAYGNVNVGASSSETITIGNSGVTNLTNIAASISGTNASNFTINSAPASTLAPGAATTLTVQFNATNAANMIAALQITSSDSTVGSGFDVTLSGTGFIPPPSISSIASNPAVPGNTDTPLITADVAASTGAAITSVQLTYSSGAIATGPVFEESMNVLPVGSPWTGTGGLSPWTVTIAGTPAQGSISQAGGGDNHTTPISLTNCTTTNGSPIVACASTASLWPGMLVAGMNVPTGTTMSSITNSTAFVIGANATASGSAITLSAEGITLTGCSTTSGNATVTCASTAGLIGATTVALTGCSTTSGSTTVTCNSTTGLLQGMTVTGTDLGNNSIIASITSSTQFVVSAPATATGSSLTLTATLSGMPITGSGIPNNVTVSSVTSSTAFVLSATATATASNVTLTAPGCGLVMQKGDSTYTDTMVTTTNEIPAAGTAGTLIFYAETQNFVGNNGWTMQLSPDGGTTWNTRVSEAAASETVNLTGCSLTSGSATVTCASTIGLAAGMAVVNPSVSLTACATTSGSAAITCASTTGLLPGMVVTGTGIPANATVSSITSSTQFVLSSAATSTNASETLVAVYTLELTACSTASGSTTVTCASTTGLVAGMSVTGTDLAGNAVVSSITSSTQFLISVAATGTTSAQTFTASNIPNNATISSIASSTQFVMSVSATVTASSLNLAGTSANHGFQLYSYNLQSSELVNTLKMRFQFSGYNAVAPLRSPLLAVDDINVTTTVGSPPVTVTMTSLGNGVYEATLPAEASGTTVSYYITATDSNGSSTTSATERYATGPKPSITTTSLSNGTVGATCLLTLAGSGGTPGYAWTVTSGALPTGLTLSSGGVLSGTPTASGVFNFTVTLTDSAGRIATQSYTLTVTGGSVTVAITSPAAGLSTTASTVTVGGTTADSAYTVTGVTVNGVAATSSDGFATWTAAVPVTLDLNTITATAIDNASPTPFGAVTSTTITQVANSTSDGLPNAWKATYGLSINSTTGNNGPLGNPSGDGIPNILKYAFNMNPLKEGVVPVTTSTTSNAGQNYLTLSYIQRTDTVDLTYLIQTSSDLNNWTTPSQMTVLSAVQNGDGASETVTVQVGPPVTSGSTNLFTRVQVTLQ